MNVAIIPARGGSKRIPDKNIKPFLGKPIIAYSIETAKISGLFDRIIVSTDSQTIAHTAKEYGAEVPFMRPKNLSDDFTPTAPVLLHALKWMSENEVRSNYVCCIYATAPFIQPDYIKKGLGLIMSKRVSSVFSVSTFPFSIFRALNISDAGYLKMFWSEHELTRSNDLPEAYYDAGQFYWLDSKKFLKTKKIYTGDALPVILPRCLVQDIDTPEDWETAELMYEVARKRGLL
ncbi:MAG: pseudaminic acid cytidylyltransferase [Desulfobacterales bacterium]